MFTFFFVSGKLAANLGTPWCMSLRFSLIGSIRLISQWAIMLHVIIIKARARSCYYPCTRPNTAGGGHNCWIVWLCFQSFISSARIPFTHSSSPLVALGAEPAGHPPGPVFFTMDRNLRLLASCLLCVLCSGAEETRSRERVYYIGIIEDTWNYAPSGKNLLNGKDIAVDEWVWIWYVSTVLSSEAMSVTYSWGSKFYVIVRGCERLDLWIRLSPRGSRNQLNYPLDDARLSPASRYWATVIWVYAMREYTFLSVV